CYGRGHLTGSAKRGRILRTRRDGFRSLPAPGTAARIWFFTIEHMTIQRMEHVGIVVDDLAAATEFFVELGLVLQGEGPVEGRWVDRIVVLEGVRADIAMLQTPGWKFTTTTDGRTIIIRGGG